MKQPCLPILTEGSHVAESFTSVSLAHAPRCLSNLCLKTSCLVFSASTVVEGVPSLSVRSQREDHSAWFRLAGSWSLREQLGKYVFRPPKTMEGGGDFLCFLWYGPGSIAVRCVCVHAWAPLSLLRTCYLLQSVGLLNASPLACQSCDLGALPLSNSHKSWVPDL